MSRKKLIGIVAACIIVVIVVLVMSLSGRGSVVTFPDPNLETAIREALNKQSGPIHASELAGLASLTAYGSGIEDLSELQYCTNLTDLNLWHNQISDISSLANLISLT
jgi:Leucine-rich repeat (LRR) protein